MLELWRRVKNWYYHWYLNRRYPRVKERGLTRAKAKLGVGKGWHNLVDQVYDICDVYDIVVSDVKQKYAGLRVAWWWPEHAEDYEPDYDGVTQALLTLEDDSYRICEECGQAGEPVEVHGWWYTLCAACRERMEAEHDKKVDRIVASSG